MTNRLYKKTIPSLKKMLDREFSKYIRYNYSADGETVDCFTCGVNKPIKEMHCGHHISRAISPTRYSESNCRPQCPRCNTFREGMQHIFAPNLKLEIGDYAYNQMIEESRQPWKWSKDWLIEKIEYYRELNREMGTH